MRGHRHTIKVYGLRHTLGASPTMEPIRDSEGRYQHSPTDAAKVLIREVSGFIGFPRRQEVGADGEAVDNAAHLPAGTVVARGDEVEAVTGDPNLDGRYQVTGVQVGRALVRVLLRRRTT